MLEFHQIVEQVYRMGGMISNLPTDFADLMRLARQRFEASSDLDSVWERIQWVRQPDVSGYRGAAPMDLSYAEPINGRFDAPESPPQATIIACDGSQVYPSEQSPWHYYLLNIGLFVFYHGLATTPDQYTFPQLKFHPSDVHDKYGRIITNRMVDDRRTVEELRTLSEATKHFARGDVPVMAMYDNRLMYMPGNDGDDSQILMNAFFQAMTSIRDSRAALVGYIDNPFRSKRFVQLLYLMSLKTQDEVKRMQRDLTKCGDLEGLRDREFFSYVLEPGQRSAVMVQNSPQNKEYRDEGRDFEIAFFYLKVVSALNIDRVVRVDIPMWVARDRESVDMVHSLILSQCRLQGRNPYPYAITRADELAYVGGPDSKKLEELITMEVRRVRQEIVGRTLTAKMRGKDLARSFKRYHNMMGQEMIDDN